MDGLRLDHLVRILDFWICVKERKQKNSWDMCREGILFVVSDL